MDDHHVEISYRVSLVYWQSDKPISSHPLIEHADETLDEKEVLPKKKKSWWLHKKNSYDSTTWEKYVQMKLPVLVESGGEHSSIIYFNFF